MHIKIKALRLTALKNILLILTDILLIGEYSLKHFEHIIFDLDGTLIDTKSGVFGSVKKALSELSLPIPDDEHLKGFMGPPLEIGFSEICGLQPETVKKAVVIFRKYYENGGMYDAKPFDGIPELLEELRTNGHILFVATSKYERIAQIIIGHFGLENYFASIAGSPKEIETPWLKRDSIKKALDGFKNISGENTVIIGDRKFDAEGAKQAGISSIGVMYGYGGRPELESSGFDTVVPDMAALRKVLI